MNFKFQDTHGMSYCIELYFFRNVGLKIEGQLLFYIDHMYASEHYRKIINNQIDWGINDKKHDGELMLFCNKLLKNIMFL